MRAKKKTLLQLAALGFALLWCAGPAAAQERELDAAAPMLEVFFEGVPYDRAVELDDLAVDGLIAVLADPARIGQHANALVALGMNGRSDVYAVIADYAQRGVSGEIDRAMFRALRAVPFAMGHLARSDPQALQWLIQAVDYRNSGPRRSFGHMDHKRVARLLRRTAMTGLALSGQPEARRVLNQLARSRNERVRNHALSALDEHARLATDGADAVFGSYSRNAR